MVREVEIRRRSRHAKEEANLTHEPMVPGDRQHTVDLDDAIGRASGREPIVASSGS